MAIPSYSFKNERIYVYTWCIMKASAVERTRALDFKLHPCTLFLVMHGRKLLTGSGPGISLVGVESQMLQQ